MKIHKLITTLVKYIEKILILLILSAYTITITVFAFKKHDIIATYFIFSSFIYYVIMLKKSPGSLLDFGNANIRGLCNQCNRIKGDRTKHCYICNKCYNKLDHHNMLIGSCIAENNILEMILCNLFLLLFFLICMHKETYSKFLFIFSFGIFIFISWLIYSIGKDKTMKEIDKNEYKRFNFKNFKFIIDIIKTRPLKILFPFFSTKAQVDYQVKV